MCDNEGRQLINIAVIVDEVLKLLIPQEDVQIEKVNLNHSISACSFYQIVSNIISNAIKYNDKEVLNLRICFDQDTSLSFKDNGPE
jgi:signal transduction histidine kinase